MSLLAETLLAGDYEALLDIEVQFLAQLDDDEVRWLYSVARAGDKRAILALVRIAQPGWRAEEMTAKQRTADTALELLFQFRWLSH